MFKYFDLWEYLYCFFEWKVEGEKFYYYVSDLWEDLEIIVDDEFLYVMDCVLKVCCMLVIFIEDNFKKVYCFDCYILVQDWKLFNFVCYLVIVNVNFENSCVVKVQLYFVVKW